MLEQYLIYIKYLPLIAFLGSFIGGEQFIILLSLLSGQGLFSFWIVFIFLLLGTLCSDMVWFFLGRWRIWSYIKRKKIAKPIVKFKKNVDSFVKERFFMTLLISKFTYGTRIASIIYLGRRKMKFLSFIFYNLLISSVLVFTISFVGWLSGKGIIKITGEINDLRIFFLIIVLSSIALAVLVNFIIKLIRKLIEKDSAWKK